MILVYVPESVWIYVHVLLYASISIYVCEYMRSFC